ncbi:MULTISPECIES: FHA domain-containing protein [unclassified Anabaena]|uniref:FHA domain-containing protein n=1 Tax=unclassified Anabaena TaxID=2619674 RepID=UPI0039C6BC25
MQIQLTWIDPNTAEHREPLLETPVVIGRNFQQMPHEINGKRVSRVVINDDLVADYHALIDGHNQELMIIAQNTNFGLKVNGLFVNNGKLKNGDRLQIGNCEIEVKLAASAGSNVCDRLVGFLFKRRCDRTDKIGCPHCNESYEEDYAFYSNYGNYRSGDWGHNYYEDRDYYVYDSYTGNVNFTEADAVSLEHENDTDFEYDMGAS